jgi:hypothetical protein
MVENSCSLDTVIVLYCGRSTGYAMTRVRFDRPPVREADSPKWKVTHWKSVNTRAFELSRWRGGRCCSGGPSAL